MNGNVEALGRESGGGLEARILRKIDERLATFAAAYRVQLNDSGVDVVRHRLQVLLAGATLTDDPAHDEARLTLPASGGPGAQVVYNSPDGGLTTQTLHDNTDTAIAFDTVIEDDAGFWNPSFPTRLTVPPGYAGRYLVGGALSYVNNASGTRSTRVALNGGYKIATNLTAGSSTNYVSHTPVGRVHLAEGDYIELRGTQTSGGDLDIGLLNFNETPKLWLQKVA